MTKFFNILKVLTLIIVAIGFVLFVIYNHRLNVKFTKLEVNSTVVKRDNWQLRTTEFYLQNKIVHNHLMFTGNETASTNFLQRIYLNNSKYTLLFFSFDKICCCNLNFHI